MTQFEPTLLIEEVLISKGTNTVYREKFHAGVNIISGENSSGKSTILGLIVYGLGADITSWSEHAKLCDRVMLQVKLNRGVVTLSREISPKSGQPMDFFAGTIEKSLAAPRDAWTRFPYRAMGGKETFSQALFRLLEIPELETETSGKLTMHQILRLLYSDQLSSVEHIFRDDNFDTPAQRDAVGRLLMGAYDGEIYANQLKIRKLEKDLAVVQSSLRSLYVVLGDVEHSLTVEWARAEHQKVQDSLIKVSQDIIDAQSTTGSSQVKMASLEPQKAIRRKMTELQGQIIKLEGDVSELTLDIADSEMFITTLERKAQALQDSQQVANELGTVQYTNCPSCRAPLLVDSNSHTCHLCKEAFDEERLRQRIVAQLNQMTIQLNQSQDIQQSRYKELQEKEEVLSRHNQKWAQLNQELHIVAASPTTKEAVRLQELNERQGYLRRELEAVSEKVSLISRLDDMSREKASLSAGILELEDRNERLRATEREKLLQAYTQVADQTASILRDDLLRQDSFQDAQSINFDFGKDKISVDGQSYFSASSTVYLKNAFLSAFLFSACANPQFRHPRFLILDTIEDKGMEPERSQNFQELIVDRSNKVDVDHQIIFATAMISPNLNDGKYIIGSHSRHDERTLNLL